MDTNFRSTFYLIKSFLPYLIKYKKNKGKIILVGSVASFKGAAKESLYCASKFAQWGFAQSLDAEIREYGISMTFIAPGGVNTNFDNVINRAKKPISKLIDPIEVARTIKFLLGSKSNYRISHLIMRPFNENIL